MKQILLLLSTIFVICAKAQVSSKFCTVFGGGGVEIGYSVKETYGKQYVLVGSTTSYGSGSSDAYLVLSDSLGRGIWEKSFGGVLSDVAKSVIINPADSGFILTGFTNSFGNGGFDIYVVRTDKNGNMKWQTSYGGLDWDFATDLVQSSDGNIVVCGNTFNSSYGKKDALVMKFDIITGALIWKKCFGGLEDDEFNGIKLTSDGDFSLAGNTNSYGDLNGDFWLFKINSNGDSLTSKKIGTSNKKEYCYDFMEDDNHDLVFCGSYDTSFYNSGKNIAYIVKTDLAGVFKSENKTSGAFTNDDKFLAISKNKAGGLYFLSRKVNHVGSGFGIDVQPFLMNSSYGFYNATTYGNTNTDEAFDVIYTSDRGYLMVGHTSGFNLVSEDVFLIKLDSSLLNSPVIVGHKEEEKSLSRRNTYFFGDKIYFTNPQNLNLSYQIVNSQGVIVESSSTQKDFVIIRSDLPPDIYLFKFISTKDNSLKFIKN